MKKILRTFSVLLLLLVVIPTVGASCKGQAELSVYGTPLTIAIDTSGNITLSVDSGLQIPTPLGVVRVGAVINPADHYDVPNTLVVRINGEDHIFDLHGKDFRLVLQSGYYEAITVEKSGKNLFLEVRSGGGSGESILFLPMYERASSYVTTLVLQRVEIANSYVKIYFDVSKSRSDVTFTPDCMGLYEEATTSYGCVSLPGEVTELAPMDVQPALGGDSHYSGYATFSRSLFDSGKKYIFFMGAKDTSWSGSICDPAKIELPAFE